MSIAYLSDFPRVGSRAPWRERMEANVRVQVGGRSSEMGEGTE